MKRFTTDYRVLLIGILIVSFSCSKVKNPPPVASSIEPQKGLVGDPVSIKGSNLDNALEIKFNNKTSLILNNSATEITSVVPPESQIGANQVVIKTNGGTTDPIQFEVVAPPENTDPLPPEIEKTIPNSNFIDYPVLIYGKFLSGVISLTFDGIEAEVFTNNSSVITATVPKGVSTGLVEIKVRTMKGTSTINFNVQDPPPNGIIPINFSIMNIPPPNYVPLISNQWSCGLFSEEGNNTFVNLDSDDGTNTFSITGKYEYDFDSTKDYNKLNYVEITDTETGEILAGQFSSQFDNPCIYRMILISSVSGEVFECTVDISDFSDCDE